MHNYSGFEWLLIDAANQFGYDKMTFEKRIEWSTDKLAILEDFIEEAETKPMYVKAVMAIRKAQQGIPTGHMVGVDSVCSGIQIMSVLTGCVAGATATGCVDPDLRADAYSSMTDAMGNILGNSVVISRDDAKSATMKSFYGSKAVPKALFGEDTPELEAFYKAATVVAPGAWELLQDLLASWQPYALLHSWKMPDGFDVKIKVMEKKEVRIEVDELNHATFTYEFYENQGMKTGLSNVANMTHSVDAYILRSMHRRCNYDDVMVQEASKFIEEELISRHLYGQPAILLGDVLTGKAKYYVDQYKRSVLADVVILPYLDSNVVRLLSTAHLQALSGITDGMLSYVPFDMVTIHDEFRSHANNVNYMRHQYKEILAEIAESNLLDDLLGQIIGKAGKFNKPVNNLGDLIRGSNYALS